MFSCKRCSGDLVDLWGALLVGDKYHLELICRECDLGHWATFYLAELNCDDFEEIEFEKEKQWES